jgi:predicted AAA+ superfamily ATPase
MYIKRGIGHRIEHALKRGKSVLLLGPRQTGKTTLVERMNPARTITFARAENRQRYEKYPALLADELRALARERTPGLPLVVLDEVQKVPALLDSVQDLIDNNIAQFILTGSSARKLRRHQPVNLLPGRVSVLYLDPFSILEYPESNLEKLLLDGSLPGIVGVPDEQDREQDLADYVLTYLEEEVRAEAAVRNLGAFARFLELAASESGRIINFHKMAMDVGVTNPTIAGYFQVLEDCLIASRIEPLSKSSTRSKLTKSDRYLFFDLGVRRSAAREGRRPPSAQWGNFFEQFIGLELLRHFRSNRSVKLRFWRDPDGPEVDWVLDVEGTYLPIEVKWTDAPTLRDARHLQVFAREYPTFGQSIIICRTPERVMLSPSITALPWQNFLDDLDALIR